MGVALIPRLSPSHVLYKCRVTCDRRERSRYNLYVQRRATGNRGWGRGGGGVESTEYTLGSIIYLRDRAGGSIVTVLFLQSCQIRLVHHPSTVN